ncbi:hypothetical protein CEXT_768211 [Caerostris extrusa]|uniref:Uncharacterized protein n=1 Tax=Caerostris extrusa TaxID=172846 RepID=A0AAV4QUN4_CAEEX|nr:hypothetical protein CEXT_768211 [Caerostris extrusa]
MLEDHRLELTEMAEIVQISTERVDRESEVIRDRTESRYFSDCRNVGEEIQIKRQNPCGLIFSFVLLECPSSPSRITSSSSLVNLSIATFATFSRRRERDLDKQKKKPPSYHVLLSGFLVLRT